MEVVLFIIVLFVLFFLQVKITKLSDRIRFLEQDRKPTTSESLRAAKLETQIHELKARLRALEDQRGVGLSVPEPQEVVPPQPEPEPESAPEPATTESLGVPVHREPPPAPSSPVTPAPEPVPEVTLETTVAESPAPESKPTPPPIPGEEPVLAAASDSQEEPTPARSGPDWMEVLRKCHILPPDGQQLTEVRLASWWATRIGIVLGVIAAVFFAVHVSEHTSPLVKLLELLAVGVVLVAIGLRLQKSLKAFGEVLCAGGLAIFYVSAYAAYNFAPLKVLDSSLAGLGVQLLAVAFMAGFAVWRRSEPIASIGISLGYVSCWFSYTYGQESFTLLGLVLFAAAGAVLLWWRRWSGPVAVSFLGSYGGYILLAPSLVRTHEIFLIGSLFSIFIILHAAIQITHLTRHPLPDRLRMGGVLVNSSLAIVAGIFAMGHLPEGWLTWYFLGMGVLLTVLTLLEIWRPGLRPLWLILMLKAAGAFACFSIAKLQGPFEWLAIALEAGLVLYFSRMLRSRLLEVAFLVLWIAGQLLLLQDVIWSLLGVAKPLPATDRYTGFAFILVQTVTLSFFQRQRTQVENEGRSGNPLIVIWLSVFAGLGLAALFGGTSQTSERILQLIIVATVVAPLCYLLRAWVPIVVSSTTFLFATLYYLFEPGFGRGDPFAILNGSLLIGAGIVTSEMLRHQFANKFRIAEALRFAALVQACIAFGALLGHWHWNADFSKTLNWLYGGSPMLVLVYDELAIGLRLIAHSAWALVAVLILSVHAQSLQPKIALPYRAIIASLLLAIFLIVLWTMWYADHPISHPPLPIACLLPGTVILFTCLVTRDAIPLVTAMLIPVGYFLYFLDTFSGKPPVRFSDIFLLVTIPIGISTLHNWWLKEGVWKGSHFVDGVLHALWLLALTACFHSMLDTATFVACSASLSLLTYVGSLFVRLRELRTMAPLPAVVATIVLLYAFLRGDAALDGPPFLLWVAFVDVLVLWIIHRYVTRKVNGPSHWGLGFTCFFLGFTACRETLDMPWMLTAIGAVGALYHLIWKVTSIRPAGFIGALVLLFSSFAQFAIRFGHQPTRENQLALATLGLLTLIAGLFMATAPRTKYLYPDLRVVAAWGYPLATLIILYPAWAWEGSPAFDYATALWGVMGVLVFLGGLILRQRPYRIIGLLGLGCCVIRVFAVDIKETFFRIVAFGVLAVVLLLIGYLYARFREFIERETS